MADSSSRSGIVVGVDGSQHSIDALRWAMRLAPVVGGGVRAICCWEFPPAGRASAEMRPDLEAERILGEALKNAFGDSLPEGLTHQVTEGRAARVLIDASGSAEMLIVGGRGLGGFAGLVLGSVSNECSHHAKSAVLVVHTAYPQT